MNGVAPPGPPVAGLPPEGTAGVGRELEGMAAASLQTAISIATFFIAKEALAVLSPGPMLLFRTAGAAMVLGVVLRVTRHRERSDPKSGDLWRLAALGIVGVPMNQGCFLLGLSLTSPAHAALLFALTPAVVAAIGAVRGSERLPASRIAGIGVALAGVVIVLFGPAMLAGAPASAPAVAASAGPVAGAMASRFARPELMGDLLILVAVISWGSYTALARGVVARLGALRATTGALTFGAAAYFPLGLFLARDLEVAAVPARGWLGLAWLVVMASTVAYLCWYYAIKRLDPSRVAIFVNLQPVGATLVAWALLGQPITVTFLAGGALVLIGVFLTQRSR